MSEYISEQVWRDALDEVLGWIMDADQRDQPLKHREKLKHRFQRIYFVEIQIGRMITTKLKSAFVKASVGLTAGLGGKLTALTSLYPEPIMATHCRMYIQPMRTAAMKMKPTVPVVEYPGCLQPDRVEQSLQSHHADE